MIGSTLKRVVDDLENGLDLVTLYNEWVDANRLMIKSEKNNRTRS